MALLQDLIKQVDDPELRERILMEVNKLNKQKKFGLVFEEHLPECTPLYDVKIKRGSKVALKAGKVDDIYLVRSIAGANAICEHRQSHEVKEFLLDDLVAIAEFGEPIYPYLKPIDSICNAPDSDLWHTLIEADNYHALQLLEYLYAEKVDCIYIDPPYNTGESDWKYNDNFIDSSDAYMHSKWLSFMKKRLDLAKKLLSPKGTIVISIGYQEINRLMILCEEIFSDRNTTCVTVQTSGGKPNGGFTFMHEYLVFITEKQFQAKKMSFTGGVLRSPYEGLTLSTFYKTNRPNQAYPIFIDAKTHNIVGVGKSLQERITDGSYTGDKQEFKYDYDEAPEGTIAVWPVSSKGKECVWRLIPERLMHDWKKGFIKVTQNKSSKNRNNYSIQYLPEGVIKKIESDQLIIVGHEKDSPTLILGKNATVGGEIPTIWLEKSFFTVKGSSALKRIFSDNRFPYPKSVSFIKEIIQGISSENSVIVDFFAGTGTTLIATLLLNAEDGGKRRCICVTNNELSKGDESRLKKQGCNPNDSEWNNLGIARHVTWPRTVCSIKGVDINGDPLEGTYGTFHEAYVPYEKKGIYKKVKIADDEELAKMNMSDGFKANAAFFKLGFLDKNAVALGRQFRELLPVLWMKADCIGPCPELNIEDLSEMLVLPKNQFAVLINEAYYAEFDDEMQKHPEIRTIYIITNSEQAYREMIRPYEEKDCYQLYRDYLDNFRINTGR